MPRPDRGVAQRYAAKKRKRRAAPTRASGTVVGPIRSSEELDEAALPAGVVTPLPRLEPRRAAPIGAASPVARPRISSRRPFSSYADEYRYVFGDLRRVALVAGSLLLVLIVLSFFIR